MDWFVAGLLVLCLIGMLFVYLAANPEKFTNDHSEEKIKSRKKLGLILGILDFMIIALLIVLR